MTKIPFVKGYVPKLEKSFELEPKATLYFQSLRGNLRLMVKLRHVFIMAKDSMLSSFLALPRVQSLKVAWHMLGYLHQKKNSRLACDLTYPEIDHSQFRECDWIEFYSDVKEAIPLSVTEPRGK